MFFELIRSFVFNRVVLALLVGGCFLVTAVDLFLDNSQAKLVDFSALEMVRTNAQTISQCSTHGLSNETIESFNTAFKGHDVPLQLRLIDHHAPKDSFQKEALVALTKDPNTPFYQFEGEEESLLRYAFINNWGMLELDLALSQLSALADRQSKTIFWMLLILAFISSVSLAVFFGYLRRSSEVLVEIQRKALDYQTQLSLAYERFFPHEFLSLLNKKTAIDIKLGDHAERQMAVLFCDIRNFTALTEKKTPAESFQFINDYLHEVGPIITKHQGFIDKYIGDAIMALFDRADDALSAILDMLETLKTIGKAASDSSKVVQEIGASIHFGLLMVGTVGEEHRMDGTVISDVVNTASRLESLNKAYGTHVLVSEPFIDRLTDKSPFKIRFIDHIFIFGKQEAIKIFEVFNADSPEIIQKKEQIQEKFLKAVENYRNRQFDEALALFQQCQSIYPEDKVTTIFIERTQNLIAHPPDPSWLPIVRLEQKDKA